MFLPSHWHETPAHCAGSLWSSRLACALTFYKTNINLAVPLNLATSVSRASPRCSSSCRIISGIVCDFQISLSYLLSFLFQILFCNH